MIQRNATLLSAQVNETFFDHTLIFFFSQEQFYHIVTNSFWDIEANKVFQRYNN